ncbi:MAG TPA: hypothetical protein VE264_05020 [Nitrososphaera sp.]|jgi:hypothetical protein|nr:hypothetical protein [Nitrososphaera sp.]
MKNNNNTKNITAAVAIAAALLFTMMMSAAAPAGRTTPTASAQMTFDEWCGAICNTQEESSQNMEEAGEELEAEEQAEEEQFGGGEGNVPTVDEFADEVQAKGEFDDQREAEEQADNGIEDPENTASVRLLQYDLVLKTELLNQTFTRMLNSSETPDIEEAEEEIDSEGEIAQRQIISYIFEEDNPNDDIRIYTAAGETVENLTSVIATNNINTTGIELFGNGRMIITCDGANSFDEADDTRIYAPHNYTVINGYRYTNSTIYDSAGQEILRTGIPRLQSSTEAAGALC